MQEYQNAYQTAREAAGFTQEKAAELLDCSVKSVQCYEQDITQPSPSIVARMSRAYGAPWLANHRCNECPLGVSRPRPETAADLRQLAIELQLEVSSGQQLDDARRLLTIARDGVITADERDDYMQIVDRLYRSAYLAEMATLLRPRDGGER